MFVCKLCKRDFSALYLQGYCKECFDMKFHGAQAKTKEKHLLKFLVNLFSDYEDHNVDEIERLTKHKATDITARIRDLRNIYGWKIDYKNGVYKLIKKGRPIA